MRNMMVYLVACTLAAIAPWLPIRTHDAKPLPPFPGWPAQFEGRTLTALPTADREAEFARSMEGRVARFTDGRREIIIRWISRPDRRLHPAADCFKGIGYHVSPGALFVDSQGNSWNSFNAIREGTTLNVRECICDDHGKSWPDVSAWYWSAVTDPASGPWWAFTVAELESTGEKAESSPTVTRLYRIRVNSPDASNLR